MAIYLKYEWLKTSTNIHKSQSCIVPKLFVVSTGPRVHVSWCHHLGFASFPKPVAWFFGLVNHLLHFSAASHGSNFWEQAYHWTRNLIYSQSLQQILLNYSKLQLQCESMFPPPSCKTSSQIWSHSRSQSLRRRATSASVCSLRGQNKEHCSAITCFRSIPGLDCVCEQKSAHNELRCYQTTKMEKAKHARLLHQHSALNHCSLHPWKIMPSCWWRPWQSPSPETAKQHKSMMSLDVTWCNIDCMSKCLVLRFYL